jgi:hypothetical protein
MPRVRRSTTLRHYTHAVIPSHLDSFILAKIGRFHFLFLTADRVVLVFEKSNLVFCLRAGKCCAQEASRIFEAHFQHHYSWRTLSHLFNLLILAFCDLTRSEVSAAKN